MLRDQQVLHDVPANQMLLDDPLEYGRITCSIPRTFGIDDGNRAAFADLEAVGLRAKNATLVRQRRATGMPIVIAIFFCASVIYAAFRSQGLARS